MHTHEMTRLWVALNVLHYSLSIVGGNLAPKALLALNFNIQHRFLDITFESYKMMNLTHLFSFKETFILICNDFHIINSCRSFIHSRVERYMYILINDVQRESSKYFQITTNNKYTFFNPPFETFFYVRFWVGKKRRNCKMHNPIQPKMLYKKKFQKLITQFCRLFCYTFVAGIIKLLFQVSMG